VAPRRVGAALALVVLPALPIVAGCRGDEAGPGGAVATTRPSDGPTAPSFRSPGSAPPATAATTSPFCRDAGALFAAPGDPERLAAVDGLRSVAPVELAADVGTIADALHADAGGSGVPAELVGDVVAAGDRLLAYLERRCPAGGPYVACFAEVLPAASRPAGGCEP
jgi:hypothetical protein